MRALDTSEAAADLQTRLQASLTPGERILRALQASTFAREFAKASLRRENPGMAEDEINRELVRRLYGEMRHRRER